MLWFGLAAVRSFWLPLSLRIVGPSGHTVFPGAGGAAGLAGYGGVAAAFAEAERFGLSASFLLTESAVLHALGGLVSVPVVLESFLSPGLDLGWVWLSAVPRLSGCGGFRVVLSLPFGERLLATRRRGVLSSMKSCWKSILLALIPHPVRRFGYMGDISLNNWRGPLRWPMTLGGTLSLRRGGPSSRRP